ncbi:hypothetical protein SAMN05660477_02419 [Soonwooa buanensis]|uniref:Lipoprotein n=1 Tax=Soonwooa buanensis TaxID=619805 RepID=A0A1T5FXX5_9FLAO|nr:hypothetical protein [Soonwooa buanensis]SKC01011.1 hypothetical protein SAMN05660477_02419 [Soonwooa buanensis]
MFKKLVYILPLILLTSCSSWVYKPTPKEHLSKERIALAKSFVEEFIHKCENRDYTPIVGFNLDINLNASLQKEEEFKKTCEKHVAKYGKVVVGDYHSAITPNTPRDYADFIVFNMTSEKKDSLKYMAVMLYRDKDYIAGFTSQKIPAPKLKLKLK